MKSFNNLEILQIIDSVSHEKSIPKDSLFQLIEDALRASAKRQYGFDPSINVILDRNTGEVKIFREMVVVENDYDLDQHNNENWETERSNDTHSISNHRERITEKYLLSSFPIRLEDAQRKAPNVTIGDTLREQLPPLDVNRFTARIAKNVVSYRIKEIERDRQYEEFKNRIGEVIQGTVDKIEFGNLIVKIGDAEAILKRSHLLRNDRYRRGDRIKAYLMKINRQPHEPQLVLSRTANEFVSKLFEHEVPEIYDHIVEIISVVRDPGSRSKIAVYASDPGIDPVGACVGIRGSRVQAVINELHGEKVDIIQWTDDKAKLVLNALAPLDVLRLIIDEKNNCVEVIVEDGQESAAIGRRGQNVRLIAELIGMNVIIMTKDSEVKRRKKETDILVKIFVDKLDLEEMLAQLLVAEGYTKITELANATIESLTKIPGLDVNIAQELIDRANQSQKEFVAQNEESKVINVDNQTQSESEIINHVDSSDIKKLSEIFPNIIQILDEAGIKTAQKIADFDNLELKEFLEERGYSCDINIINDVIMTARKL